MAAAGSLCTSRVPGLVGSKWSTNVSTPKSGSTLLSAVPEELELEVLDDPDDVLELEELELELDELLLELEEELELELVELEPVFVLNEYCKNQS